MEKRQVPTRERPMRLMAWHDGSVHKVKGCRDFGCSSATLGAFCSGHARLILLDVHRGSDKEKEMEKQELEQTIRDIVEAWENGEELLVLPPEVEALIQR
jgi:hypothetical protein